MKMLTNGTWVPLFAWSDILFFFVLIIVTITIEFAVLYLWLTQEDTEEGGASDVLFLFMGGTLP